MLELKDYQRRTLRAFTEWEQALGAAREECEQRALALARAGLEPSADDANHPAKAWTALAGDEGGLAAARPHVDRFDGAERSIPHVCFKIPTGGGKTLLGAAALERLGMQTGFVLWIVPSRAIYAQTRKAFWTRQHPYRQLLEFASGGRVKVMEKDDRLAQGDLDNYLCLMLLMLPAANRRRGKEFLRMFRDSGRYATLFPREDDVLANEALRGAHTDLEINLNGTVKHSLFNVLKMQRPVVVLDEAHKAYGGKGADEFVSAVNRLNPRLVIELSATPNAAISNLLVDVSGADLGREEMIKLPVEVSTGDGDWTDTLACAHDRLADLTTAAQQLEGRSGRYIRPIGVIRVERTGKDQRGSGYLHAEDVREHLIGRLGEAPEAVRVKSSQNDEIAGEDLMSPYSPVRWIITKAALMEGWDCPFAYVLVMLDNTRSNTAITQLMGRVMRQPGARRTGDAALDRCYVHCWQAGVDESVTAVKNGLENEGLTGLGQDVQATGALSVEPRAIARRPQFRGADIFLPKVLVRRGEEWVDLSYERDILPGVDWAALGVPDTGDHRSGRTAATVQTISIGLDDAGISTSLTRRTGSSIDKPVSVVWFVRQLTDMVPNPWQAARLALGYIELLSEEGHDDGEVYADRRWHVNHVRECLAADIDLAAQAVFVSKLRSGDIRFDLEASEPNFKMTDTFSYVWSEGDHTFEHAGRPIQQSLFETLYEKQFDSDLERRFAFYLDEHQAIDWWHRVAARQSHDYYLRGWQNDRIWPDFVALSTSDESTARLLVVDTKGEHLAGNANTSYKQQVFATLEEHFNGSDAFDCGEVKLGPDGQQGRFRIVFHEHQFDEVLA
ncbi:MAG: DEAD/DEAH box helicase family protein [Acidimicrobiaceae bacterium]|nr:DEAD/DEAH box helicase family protein [Acidimicrobiaceae bacterium]